MNKSTNITKPTNWRKVKLGEVTEINPPLPLDKGTKYPYIPMEDLSWDKKYVASQRRKKFVGGGARFEDEDILFARITPCLENGKMGRVSNLEGEKGFGSTEFFVFRGKNNFADTDFLYYLSRTNRFRQTAINSMVGASGRQRARIESLKSYEFYLPKVGEQKRIAAILSAFDDKIELNNKINEILEKTAQAIFKEWFARNQGKKYSLLDIADYVNGGAFGKIINKSKRGLPLIKIAELNRGITENTEWVDKGIDKKYHVRDGDLLFSWSGSVGVYIWDKGRGILNQHIFNIIPKNDFSLGFLYFLLKSKIRIFQHIAGAKATTMGHIKKEHLRDESIFIPDNKNLGIFDDFYKQTVTLRLENQKLASLRDFLLPKLMSGELQVQA